MVKVNRAIWFVLVFVLLSACKTYDRYSGEVYDVNGIGLYTSLAGVSSKMEAEFQKKKIKRAIVINGGAYEIKGTQTFNKEKLRNRIIELLPARSDRALIVLDFEGQNMIDFKNGKSDKRKRILEYYKSIYDLVKKLRPNATVGFYGYPWRDYWNRNDKWRAANDELLPLFEHVDAIFPSIYDFYADGIDVKRASDLAYVKENVEEALRMAELAGGKEVYPFVWHRYHDSNKKRAKQFIDKGEFYWHVKQAVMAEYGASHIDGIVWWSSERYFYNVSERGKINKRNAQSDFERYSNETSFDYISIIENAITDGTQK